MSRLRTIPLSLILLAGWVGSQPVPRGHGPRCTYRFRDREPLLQLKAELDLTVEQQERLRAIAAECRRTAIEKGADLQTARLDLTEMLREPEPNRAEAEAKVERIGEIRTSMELARVDALFRAMEVLTVDQRDKFRSLGIPARLFLPPRKARAHRY